MIGQRLKQLRMEQGLTQKQLAEKVNLSQQTIGHYEVDRAEPGSRTIELFAAIFNTTSDYLLGLSDIPHSLPVGESPTDSLPEIAKREIEDFTEFVKRKYRGTKNGEKELPDG